MKKTVITIGREYGSGGYEIGKKLAEALGYKFYDKSLLAELAEKTMISASYIEAAEEKPVKRNIFRELIPIFANEEAEQADYIFNEQGKFIVDIARKGNCVIAGRRADYYLRDEENAVHLYFYADLAFRAERISRIENCSYEEAVRKINDMDKRRKTSYEYTTGRKWADMHNYDRMIDTSTFGVEKTLEELIHLLK